MVSRVLCFSFLLLFKTLAYHCLFLFLYGTAFQTEGKLYLVLEFLRGGDLFTRLSKEVWCSRSYSWMRIDRHFFPYFSAIISPCLPFLSGDVHGGWCQILSCRACFSIGSPSWPGHCLPWPEAWEVSMIVVYYSISLTTPTSCSILLDADGHIKLTGLYKCLCG